MSEFLTLADRLKNRGRDYTKLLCCPIDGTQVHVDGEQLICEAGHHHFSRDGIVFLLEADAKAQLDAESTLAVQRNQETGRTVPEEDQFKSLPSVALEGWGSAFWELRRSATVEMWHFLEALRRERDMLPIGDMGNAIEITADMGWLGYSLDVSGYATVVVGQDSSEYGLGAYPYARYPRIQAPLTSPPLTENSFDLVLYSWSICLLDDLHHAFANAIQLLKPDGHIIVFPEPDDDIDSIETALIANSLAVRRQRIRPTGSRLKKLRAAFAGGPDFPPLLIAARTTS